MTDIVAAAEASLSAANASAQHDCHILAQGSVAQGAGGCGDERADIDGYFDV